MIALNVAAVSRNYFNIPLWAAERFGYFADEGLAVKTTLIEPIDGVTESLRRGESDIVLGVTEHVILDAEAGGGMRIVGGNVNTMPFSLITAARIRTVEQLRGTRIGVSSLDAGSSSVIMAVLAAAGLHYPHDYELLAVGPILARWKCLQAGEIDAGLQAAPLNFIAEEAGFRRLLDLEAAFPAFAFTSVNVEGTWADAHRETLTSFMRAFLRASEAFYTQRERIAELAVEETGIEPRHAERAWEEYVRGNVFPRDGRPSIAGIQKLIEVSALVRAVAERSRRKAHDYVDSSFLEAARAGLAAQETV